MKIIYSKSSIRTWDELSKFSKLKEGQIPSLNNGKLSDPTSWSEWICGSCCKDRDPANVNAHLKKMANRISVDLKKNHILNDGKCKIIGNAISNFERLANQCGSKQVKAIDAKNKKDDVEENKKIAKELTEMKDQLALSAVDNDSYVRYAKDSGLLRKRV